MRNHRSGDIQVGPGEFSLAVKEKSQYNQPGDGDGRAPGAGVWLGARGE